MLLTERYYRFTVILRIERQCNCRHEIISLSCFHIVLENIYTYVNIPIQNNFGTAYDRLFLPIYSLICKSLDQDYVVISCRLTTVLTELNFLKFFVTRKKENVKLKHQPFC